MTRVAPFALIVTLTPALALAQTHSAPPAPPAPPAPVVAPVQAPVLPLPPTAPVAAPVQAPLPPLPPLEPVLPLPAPAPMVAPLPPLPPLPDVEWPDIDEVVQSVMEAVPLADQMNLDEVQAEMAREAAERAREQLRAVRPELLDLQNRVYTFSGQNAESSYYSSGLSALSSRRYDDAITRFDRVIAQKGAHADGALYWKAFAQYKLGKWNDSLATIADLRKSYAKSRYLADAKVLEADVRKLSGQPVDINNLDDDELKLLAIQGIQNTDPERAIPLLEGVLNATNSLRVKRQALYVLALSDQPRAHEILLSYAKGSGNPDLQREALNYLASRSRGRQPATSSELREIYESTTDANVRRWVIDAYRTAGDKNALVAIARTTAAPVVLRSRAISNLTDLAAPQDLFALYQKEDNKDLRVQMVRALSSMGAVDQLQQIAKTEQDPTVRQQAIRSLGSQKADKTGATLVEMYTSTSDATTRKAIISALASQNNAEGLVQVAHKETDLGLKIEIVRRLRPMAAHSKVAADYLAEVIKR